MARAASLVTCDEQLGSMHALGDSWLSKSNRFSGRVRRLGALIPPLTGHLLPNLTVSR